MDKRITAFLIILFTLSVSTFTFAKDKNKLSYKFDITGIQGEVKENVVKRLNINTKSYADQLTPEHIHHLYATSPDNIRDAMKPFGYFKTLITSTLTQSGNHYTAHYTVLEGPVMPLSRVQIELIGPGHDSAAVQKLVKNFPIRKGDTFSVTQYEEAKNALIDAAMQHGYMNAHFSKDEIVIDKTTYSAKIVLHLTTGEQFYFGKIQFGETFYSPGFLKRFLNIKEGEEYSTDALLDLQEKLSQSSFFSHIAINPKMNEAKDHYIPVDITVTPSASRRYSFGIGYGTYTEYRGSIDLTFRHLTRTGHHARILANASSIQAGVTTQYIIPGWKPLTDQFIIGAQKQRVKPTTGGASDYNNFSLAYLWAYSKFNFKTQLTYQQELYRVFDESESTRTHFLMPSLNVGYTSTDNVFNPKQGYKLNWGVSGANNGYFSDTTFVQTQLSGRYLYPISANNRLILSGLIGATDVQDLADLPLSLRFYTGGIGSVRGFTYGALGPGRYVKTLSFELQHRLVGNLYVAAFNDNGIASNTINHSLSKSIGPGLVYQSPVGSIQLSYARAFTTRGPRWRLEFNIGTTL